MTSAPAVVIDQLNELLQAEIGSIIRFMGAGSPYLGRATADLRSELQDMVQKIDRRAIAIADLIDRLGGIPREHPTPNSDDQYLSFLSLKFLLPKLIEAKRLLIERYQNALRATSQQDDASEATQLMRSILADHLAELAILQNAEKRVMAEK